MSKKYKIDYSAPETPPDLKEEDCSFWSDNWGYRVIEVPGDDDTIPVLPSIVAQMERKAEIK